MNIFWIILQALILVLLIITLSLSVYIFVFFRKLSKNIGRNDLIKILTKLSEIEKENSESIKTINKQIQEIKEDAKEHLQHVSFLRYNPFPEVGGDHSFSLAILDAYLTGFIITGLHTRERTRVYVKRIEKGKCKRELSKEEKDVIARAMR